MFLPRDLVDRTGIPDAGSGRMYAKKWDVRAQELWQKDRNNK